MKPKALVLVVTVRALRHHGGAKKEEYNTPNMSYVKKGFGNLEKHIENCKKFGLTAVIAINSFYSDSDEEVEFIISACATMGVKAVLSKGWGHGGEATMPLHPVLSDHVQKLVFCQTYSQQIYFPTVFSNHQHFWRDK